MDVTQRTYFCAGCLCQKIEDHYGQIVEAIYDVSEINPSDLWEVVVDNEPDYAITFRKTKDSVKFKCSPIIWDVPSKKRRQNENT